MSCPRVRPRKPSLASNPIVIASRDIVIVESRAAGAAMTQR
jgi:hypothetical protein